MDKGELQERFPGLVVGARLPGLFQLNGCGLALYFSRDFDAPTGTYVKTLCVTILWIPLFPVGAYRVSDAPTGGWFVVGREPPSPSMLAARRVALGLLLFGAFMAAWGGYRTTDGYKDGVELSGAREATRRGRIREAAERFRMLARSGRKVAESARDGLRGAVEAVSPETDPADAVAVLLAAHDPGGGAGPVLPDLWRRATAYASDPARLPVANQVQLLTSLAPLAPGADAVAAERRRLVERGAGASPPDLWSVSELALELEARSDAAGAEALLAPHAARLGDLEGARILGQIRAGQGRFEEAFPLLDRYLEKRLDRLHSETEAFSKAVAAAQEAAMEHLRRGGETEDWYARHERADEAARSRMVSEAVAARVEKDASLADRRNRYRDAARIVPVAMDLGIVRMQRARSMSDAEEERRELLQAERVLTAIDGVAAGDPEYEFAAARVAFWLGKRDACDAHLAAALEAGGDTFETRSRIGTLLASLGESAGAREHWVAAYALAGSETERSIAAYCVSVNTRDDPDGALEWVRRADASDPVVAAGPPGRGRGAAPGPPAQSPPARGAGGGPGGGGGPPAAMAHGDFAAAERALAASLAAYDRLPRNPVVLNNAALVAGQLSNLTGRVESLEDAGRRLRDALAEMPTNIVVLMNTAQTLSAIGWVRSLDGGIDLRLGVQGLRDIRHDDAAGLERIRAAARASDEMREALRLLDRGLGLVPGNADLVDTCAGLAGDLGDVARLRELVALVSSHPPDTEPGRAAYLASRARAADPAPARGFLATARAHLDGLGPGTNDRDRSVVAVACVQAAGGAWFLGVDVDLAALDADARRLHADFPSSATRTAERITAALLVHRALCASNPRYAREAGSAGPSVGPEGLLAEALYRDASLRDAVRASADFVRLVDLIEESDRKFPGELGGISRGLLWAAGRRPLEVPAGPGGVEPDWALQGRVLHATSPYAARVSIGRAWTLRVLGKPDRAEEVLRECVRLGGAIPYLE